MVLKKLQKQNKDLSATNWREFYRKEDPAGVYLVFGVNDDAVEALKKEDWWPSYEMKSVKFRLLVDRDLPPKGNVEEPTEPTEPQQQSSTSSEKTPTTAAELQQ